MILCLFVYIIKFFFSTLVLIVSNFIVACALSRVIKILLTYLITYTMGQPLYEVSRKYPSTFSFDSALWGAFFTGNNGYIP